MKPFFQTPGRIQSLHFHAAELIGTPFAKGAMVPGAGIDCIHVAAWCYLKTGFFDKFEPPKYALDSGKHSRESQVLKWLEASSQFHRVSMPAGGDTICFNMGLSEHHVGLMLDAERFIHVLFFGPRKVIGSSLKKEQYYRRRVTAVFRPMAV